MKYEYTLETMDGPEVCTYSWDEYLTELKRRGVYEYPEHEKKFHDGAVAALKRFAKNAALGICSAIEDDINSGLTLSEALETEHLGEENLGTSHDFGPIWFNPDKHTCEMLDIPYPLPARNRKVELYLIGDYEPLKENELWLSVQYANMYNPCWFGSPIGYMGDGMKEEYVISTPAEIFITIPLAQFQS